MAGKADFLRRFMTMTDKTRKVWGPADRGAMDEPVLHKHDDFEAASQAELSEFEIERDADGHAYAHRKRHEATGADAAATPIPPGTTPEAGPNN
ncbi:hypothetical protein LVY72_15735 [Arthrobacter sp. I2-34]|uniref:Uncharacterized protein n=1 Tax=Arthrobacter hankyongi TaxID=2904801 RepID=A0ABS9L9J9_9MICC|nr:hypothetical protein [Arthrobacter hankyongi]MCG2623349.1 hypothetical protein [Arthrobacter hankyongi]